MLNPCNVVAQSVLAVNVHIMETGIRSDLGVHIDSNVDRCIPETGTNEGTGSAHRRRHPPHRLPSCLSSCEHDNLAANDPSALVPFCFIGSDTGVGDANDFAIECEAVFSLE